MLSYAMITYSFTSTVGGPVVHNKSVLICIPGSIHPGLLEVSEIHSDKLKNPCTEQKSVNSLLSHSYSSVLQNLQVLSCDTLPLMALGNMPADSGCACSRKTLY